MGNVDDICGFAQTSLIPSIPSVPMSYGDVLPLLQALGGTKAADVAPDFTGDLDIEYTVGPSTDFITLTVDTKFEIRKIPNVVATIKGSLPADQDSPVLLGNHRDAWVYGAADPNSGTAALLEVSRGFGALLKKGWQPKRTIKLLSWSGEEYGLLGSTGWGELNFEELKRASAYLNVDVAVSGDNLSVSATPALATLWNEVMHDLNEEHPLRGSHLGVSFDNAPLGEVVDANTNSLLSDSEVGTLGSGSDYTVFLDRLGIASLDFTFSKQEAMYGVYHSIYDSFDWMDRYGGSNHKVHSSFDYMAGAARIWGLLAMRLAGDDVLPFDHDVQADALKKYMNVISESGELDLGDLEKAITKYKEAAAVVAGEIEGASSLSEGELASLNTRLSLTERNFLSEDGLPGRPWFKHTLQAPGLFLGYAAMAFPGVQEALDEGDVKTAEEQLGVVSERIKEAARFLVGRE